MLTIEIDSDVFDALKERAEPLIDTPNSVLRRLLDLGSADEHLAATRTGVRRVRNRPGDLLSETEYWMPILRALESRGGAAPTRVALDAVGEELGERLTPRDFEPTGNGNEKRWEARAHFARLRM